MSYTALTELGKWSICPICNREIRDGSIIVALTTSANVVDWYNKELEMEEGTVTADMDWTDQHAFHTSCFWKTVGFFCKVEHVSGQAAQDQG